LNLLPCGQQCSRPFALSLLYEGNSTIAQGRNQCHFYCCPTVTKQNTASTLHEVEVAELLLVSWHSPLALLHHRLNRLGDTRVRLCNIIRLCQVSKAMGIIKYATHSKVLKVASILNVLQSGLKVLQFNVNCSLCFLCFRDLKTCSERAHECNF
jgi:hypothetical protein